MQPSALSPDKSTALGTSVEVQAGAGKRREFHVAGVKEDPYYPSESSHKSLQIKLYKDGNQVNSGC